ncbi:MAG TPA: hypothetical protein DCE56_11205 [Cyanobacteria bacterium UBA8553]|nr:hypothetical protein [Cyanobacteria bacterium UBA8553]
MLLRFFFVGFNSPATKRELWWQYPFSISRWFQVYVIEYLPVIPSSLRIGLVRLIMFTVWVLPDTFEQERIILINPPLQRNWLYKSDANGQDMSHQ